MVKKAISYLVISASLLSFFSCSSGEIKNNEMVSPVHKSFMKNVKTTKAVLGNPQQEITLSGKVEANPDKTIRYRPLVSGVIGQTYFSLGDKVKKGQPLLDIRSTDLAVLESEMSALESEMRISSRELKTARALYEDKMIPERELWEAEEKVNQTEAALRRIRNEMSVFGTNKGNGVFSVNAPADGYITGKNVSSGSTVSSDGEPLFTIADLHTVWITANVYASNLAFVKEGMECEISTLSYPGECFYGKINTLSQVFDPEDKTLKARIIVPNKELLFKPEMSVIIKLKNENRDSAVTIPSDALIFDNDRYYVVVHETENRFAIREVKVSGHNQQNSYIASGLEEGEEVVVKNQLFIYSGLKEI